jgi:hypothetical protein
VFEKEYEKCITILKNEHPQLYTFMNKNKENFDKFFKLHNNALLTLTLDEKTKYKLRYIK